MRLAVKPTILLRKEEVHCQHNDMVAAAETCGWQLYASSMARAQRSWLLRKSKSQLGDVDHHPPRKFNGGHNVPEYCGSLNRSLVIMITARYAWCRRQMFSATYPLLPVVLGDDYYCSPSPTTTATQVWLMARLRVIRDYRATSTTMARPAAPRQFMPVQLLPRRDHYRAATSQVCIPTHCRDISSSSTTPSSASTTSIGCRCPNFARNKNTLLIRFKIQKCYWLRFYISNCYTQNQVPKINCCAYRSMHPLYCRNRHSR